LLNDTTVRCWGYNYNGQLGNGTTTDSSNPVPVSNLSGAISIAAGQSHSCALMNDNTVRCWGSNTYGQLGNGTVTQSTVPVNVVNISTAAVVATGGLHTCALLADGTLRCWDYDTEGTLGDGQTNNSSVPVSGPAIGAIRAVATGGFHTCVALQAGGTAQCWGRNDYGELGTTNPNGYSVTPIVVPAVTGATALAAAADYSCSLAGNGTVQCWGYGVSGQLGNGNTAVTATPVSVSGLSTTTAISAWGYNHTCALLANNEVECWGGNTNGQLGNNSTISSSVPVFVVGVSTAIAVAPGNTHTCALLSGGIVQCWGSNYTGELGNGTLTQSVVPATVVGF
jgi:alpha-tubulin suppressor-like RCC1 family protein